MYIINVCLPNFPYEKLKPKLTAFLLVLVGLGSTVNAQDSSRIRHWAAALSSDSMYGRGYVKDGVGKAANYLEQELSKLGLSVHRQRFEAPVHIFPEACSLKLNGRQLRPGVDFLIDPASPTLQESGSLTQLNTNTWRTRAGTILQKRSKLTWWVASESGSPQVLLDSQNLTQVPKKISVHCTARQIPRYPMDNLYVLIPGTRVPDSLIVLTAHYDHLGMMGTQAIFNGANDNASGVALLMELAQYYQNHPAAYSVVCLFFAGEELGLLGSNYFVNHPPFRLSQIRFLLNFDLMGNGDEGITVVNATEFPAAYEQLLKINKSATWVPAIYARGKAANSDHHWFTEVGVPSFFWYTMGKRKAYHDVFDRNDDLCFCAVNGIFTLSQKFIHQITNYP